MDNPAPKYDFSKIVIDDAMEAAKLLTPVAFMGATMRASLVASDNHTELVSLGRYHRWRFDHDGAIWCYEEDRLRGVASLNILAAYELLAKYRIAK